MSIQVAAAGIFKGISSISEDFETMGYNLRLVAPAVNKMLILRQAMLDAYRHAGVNLVQVVKQSILFNLSLAKTKYALEAVYKSVGAKFLPLLTKQLDIFRTKIFQNMPKIQEQLEKFVKFIFKAFEATIELGSRIWHILGTVFDFLKRLDEATGGWSTKILAFIAIWEALNLAFLATPLGQILAGLLAILALYDDFKVWEEGGKSFFNWAPFVPVINAVTTAVSALKDALGAAFMILFDYYGLWKDIFTLNFSGVREDFKNLFGDIGTYVQKAITYLKDLLNIGSAIIGWAPAAANYISGLFGGNHAQAATNSVLQPPPLVSASNGVNQKVSQETNILVQGSADASAVGKAVASQQDKVNFDMTRNFASAVR